MWGQPSSAVRRAKLDALFVSLQTEALQAPRFAFVAATYEDIYA